MFILLFFAFLAGVVTILSPCILPILPIVLSGSLTGGRKRPIGIVTGFIVSFTFFTLALTAIVKATGLPPDALRTISVIVIGLFGLSLLFPQTQVFLEKVFSRLSSLVSRLVPTATASDTKTTGIQDFLGGSLVGFSLGLIWTPCVGPILASVITLAITSQVTLAALFITLAYSIGTAIPMLLITYSGRSLFTRVPWLLANTGKIQQVFGVLMLLTAIGTHFNVDRRFQTFILETFPAYGTGLTKIEDNALVRSALDRLQPGSQSKTKNPASSTSLRDLGPAPELTGYTKWLHSEPLTFGGNLRGKVVLVDFWTYSCINCIRTLPYLTQWHEKYKDQGLVIIGVHAPEFAFEKVEENVRMAIKDFGIEYPVVQDNDFTIWRAYENRYWPAKYLVDKDGTIRYTHFGEGKYEETEKNIQLLLQEAGQSISKDKLTEPSASPLTLRLRPFAFTPETYLGYERASAYTDSMTKIVNDQATTYAFNTPLANDQVGLAGPWKIEAERITAAGSSATLTLNFYAGKVHLVLGGKNKDNLPVTVKLDGKDVEFSVVTSDFNMSGGIAVTMDRKYDILDLRGTPGRHTLELTVPPGVSAYAFTFGE